MNHRMTTTMTAAFVAITLMNGGTILAESTEASPIPKVIAQPRPAYHFTPFTEWNDVNGLIYWRGRHHLFYLGQIPAREVATNAINRTNGICDHWAHWSSADLIHWKQHPPAIVPTEPYEKSGCCWSGSAFHDGDKARIVYWADGGATCLATSTDDEMEVWTKSTSNPIIPGQPPDAVKGHGGDHAAFVWKEGITWYCIRGGGRDGKWTSAFEEKHPTPNDTANLFRSKDLIHWQYLHDLYDPVGEWWNSDAAVPKFVRLGDRHFFLYSTHQVKSQKRYSLGYYSGRYENEKFHPDHWQKIGGSPDGEGSFVHGQDVYVDDRGRTIMITKLTAKGNTGQFRKNGWEHTMSLPLVLTAKDASLQMEPVPGLLERSRSGHRRHESVTVVGGAAVTLTGISGDVLELNMVIELGTAAVAGVKVRCGNDGKDEKVIRYDRARERLSVGDNWQPLRLGANEKLKLRVFLDRSVMEVLGNKTAYLLQYLDPMPAAKNLDIRCFAEGGDAVVEQVDAWKMGNLEYAPWALNAPTRKTTKEGAAQ